MKKIILLIILCLISFLVACSSDVIHNDSPDYDPDNIKNRIFFVIHGDGSYLYHDQYGNSLNADEQALKYAIETAERLPNSEIYIYHIKKKEYFLFFFPKDDRYLYHFRNGVLVRRSSFSGNENIFIEKSEISNSHHQINNYFFYYGHEIPEKEGAGYFNSFPDRKYTIDSLANQIKRLTILIKDQFNLIVLSTCNNGSPFSIYKVMPYSKYVLASPGDLHLSYIDSRGIIEPLKMKKPLSDLVEAFTRSAFDSLCIHTKTMVTLSIYQNDIILPELKIYFSGNENHMNYQGKINNPDFIDCSECRENFLNRDIERGTKVFYRPPSFGKMKNKKHHSGWGCYKDVNENYPDKIIK